MLWECLNKDPASVWQGSSRRTEDTLEPRSCYWALHMQMHLTLACSVQADLGTRLLQQLLVLWHRFVPLRPNTSLVGRDSYGQATVPPADVHCPVAPPQLSWQQKRL